MLVDHSISLPDIGPHLLHQCNDSCATFLCPGIRTDGFKFSEKLDNTRCPVDTDARLCISSKRKIFFRATILCDECDGF